MIFDLNDPITLSAIERFTECGAASGCTFCKGRRTASVAPSDRILILKGSKAGWEATVSHEPGPSDDEFLVRFDADPPDVLTRILYKHDQFCVLPIEEPPTWLCHLSIDDLCALDDAALTMAVLHAPMSKPRLSAEVLVPVIATVRNRRLPVEGSDLWRTLDAHGFRNDLKHDFIDKVDFATEILTALHGHPAAKRRRVRAMSVGRYQTPSQERYSGPSPGIAW